MKKFYLMKTEDLQALANLTRQYTKEERKYKISEIAEIFNSLVQERIDNN